jgi:regulator of sirC expression with transglutaminase-like and TPR domain
MRTKVRADTSSTRRLFAANARRPQERIDLGLAALLLAKEEYPRLSIEDYRDLLDQMAAGLAVEVDLEAGPDAIARAVSAYMVQELGFEGDTEDYYNPKNSYLNDVMDRRRGIPISLSVLYIEVARRINVQLLPVSMPGHFLIKLAEDGDPIFIDAFNSGAILDRSGARAVYERVSPSGGQFQESMLGSATRRQVITRMLHNLKAAYIQADDDERALRMVDLLTLVTPWDLDEVRDRGLLRFRMGRLDDALPDLQAYARYGPPGPEIETVRDALRRISAL